MKRELKALVLCAVIAAVAAMLTACSERVMWAGNSYPGNMEASYKYFNCSEKQKFNLKEGDRVAFTYDSKVDEGSLSIEIADPDGKTIAKFQPDEEGTAEIKAEKSGDYKVIITGSKTRGSYSVKWKIEK